MDPEWKRPDSELGRGLYAGSPALLWVLFGAAIVIATLSVLVMVRLRRRARASEEEPISTRTRSSRPPSRTPEKPFGR